MSFARGCLPALLALVITLPAPRADAAPARARVQLVGVIPAASQALIWDADRGQYRLVKEGQRVGRARLEKVLAGGVLLRSGEATTEVRLAASPFTADRTALASPGAPAPVLISLDLSPAEYSAPPSFLGAQPARPLVRPPTSAAGAAPAPTSPPGAPEAPSAASTSRASPAAAGALEAPSAPASPADGAAPAASPAPREIGHSTPSSDGEARPSPAAPAARPAARPALLPMGELRAGVSRYLARKAAFSVTLRQGKGLLFARVPAGTLAHRLGLRSGDHLVAVSGKAITSEDAAVDIYLSLAPGQLLELVVARGPDRLVLKVGLTR